MGAAAPAETSGAVVPGAEAASVGAAALGAALPPGATLAAEAAGATPSLAGAEEPFGAVPFAPSLAALDIVTSLPNLSFPLLAMVKTFHLFHKP